ncbi:MAG: lysophospholipase [Rhizobium sp.]|nr:lysophospholipase [Rhizobium sp.]
MRFEDATRLQSPTGAALILRHLPANGAAKAVVLIAHGLAEHSLRYQRFASFLASRGYHVYAHDHRGHGHTTAPGAEQGRFAAKDGALLVLDDVIAVRNFATTRHPDLPILLFGHSMGGLIAMATAQAHPLAFDALAVWNANLNPGLAGKAGVMLLKAERFFKGSDVPSFYGPKFTFETWAKSVPGARTPFDWLSRDGREVQAYIDDPLCGFSASVSMWLDVLKLAGDSGGKPALGRLPKALPVHLVGGGHDPATDRGMAMVWLAKRIRSLGMTEVTLTIHEEMRHETLNEIGHEDAMKAFAAWADGVVARKSGKTANG